MRTLTEYGAVGGYTKEKSCMQQNRVSIEIYEKPVDIVTPINHLLLKFSIKELRFLKITNIGLYGTPLYAFQEVVRECCDLER